MDIHDFCNLLKKQGITKPILISKKGNKMIIKGKDLIISFYKVKGIGEVADAYYKLNGLNNMVSTPIRNYDDLYFFTGNVYEAFKTLV